MFVRDKVSKKLMYIDSTSFHTQTNLYKEIMYIKLKQTIKEKHTKQLLYLLE